METKYCICRAFICGSEGTTSGQPGKIKNSIQKRTIEMDLKHRDVSSSPFIVTTKVWERPESRPVSSHETRVTSGA